MFCGKCGAEIITNAIHCPKCGKVAKTVFDIELEQLIKDANNGDTTAQLRLAIKYELGLGVTLDVDQSKKYFSMANSNPLDKRSLLVDINTDEQTGVISDKYVIKAETLFNSKIRKRKNSDDDYVSEFIYACEDHMSSELLKEIKGYNKRAKRYGYDPIKYIPEKNLIIGRFVKKDLSKKWAIVRSYYDGLEEGMKREFEGIRTKCNQITIKYL